MKSLSISELKATLSEQVRAVRQGEGILVTDRGIPVARLLPLEAATGQAADHLARLERSGVLRRGSSSLPAAFFEQPGPPDPAAGVRRALGEEREQGW